MIASEANASADYWERLFTTRAWGAYPPEELVRFMARTFRTADKSSLRVLEVGCGPGPNIWYLLREGFQVAGIDGSATAIRQARDRLERDGLPSIAPGVDLRVGDFGRLPWPDAGFDAVVDIAALYANRFDKIADCIAEIHRVLKPSSVFFGKMFGTPTTGSDSGEALEPGTRSRPTIGPCAGNEIAHFFSRRELQLLFARFGELGIDQVQRSDGEVQIFEWLVKARK